VPWNIHEPQPLTYDFTGQQNLSDFFMTAQEAGLVVILRAGPYICGEWEYVSTRHHFSVSSLICNDIFIVYFSLCTSDVYCSLYC